MVRIITEKNYNNWFWMKFGLLKIVDGLVLMLSLGHYQGDYSFNFLRKQMIKDRENEKSNRD